MVQVDIAALRSIEREKEISFETIVDALETALPKLCPRVRFPPRGENACPFLALEP